MASTCTTAQAGGLAFPVLGTTNKVPEQLAAFNRLFFSSSSGKVQTADQRPRLGRAAEGTEVGPMQIDVLGAKLARFAAMFVKVAVAYPKGRRMFQNNRA